MIMENTSGLLNGKPVNQFNLSRKQLASALNQLPHPMLVIKGSINPVCKVPIYSELPVLDYDLDKQENFHEIRYLTFNFSFERLDWELAAFNASMI